MTAGHRRSPIGRRAVQSSWNERAGVLTNGRLMAIHFLRQPVASHRAFAQRRKMLALGIVLAIGIATALAFLFLS
jgi:hypothetical protein